MRKLKISVLLLAMIAALSVSCGNKESEKRIAELESRLEELESENNPASTGVTAPVTRTPEKKPEGPLATFEFVQEEHDFGDITDGDVVEHTFTFKNTGDAPLIVQDAKGSCGCTIPEKPDEPIPVGGTGEFKVKFNSKGKPGNQNKTVTITANTWPRQTVLRIKANVHAKANPDISSPTSD